MAAQMKRLILGLLLPLLVILSEAQNNSNSMEQRAKASVSTLAGTLKTPGLRQPVEVLRDRWGVAHIFAKDQHDLFFAQGFIAAQDRLFQMELWKLSGQGRLAEVLGPSALLRDVNARLLRYRGDMKAEYESYSPDTREILEAFTSGINAYIASRSDNLPIEFQVSGFRPEPWKPEDCLNRMAAFSMTGNSFAELRHAQAVALLGTEKASQLFDFDPKVTLDPAPGSDFAGLSPGLLHNLVGSDTRIEFPTYELEGSNNWTISGALTESGKPLLANDPHRVIAEPSLRYMVHLVAPGWDVIGAGEPGLPGVALGHNQHIAWGFTIFGLDQQDLYLEQLNPSDPTEYKTEHGWAKMRLEKQTFAIRGGPPVTAELEFTRHGPVLWHDKTRALALRWVGAEPGTAGYLGSLAVDRAANWQEFEKAMPRWKVPSENIVYADDQGNIGEHSIGLAPRKTWTGLLPVPGDRGYEWTGFLPSSALPHSYNPSTQFIATANHKMIPEDYAYKVGYEWAPGFRYQRISSVLSEARKSGHKLTALELGRLQNDIFSLPAEQLISQLQKAGGDPSDPARMLIQWDKNITRESAAAALYELWLGELTSSLIREVAPQKLWGILEAEWTPATVLRVLSNPQSFGLDSVRAKSILLDSLKTANDKLIKLEGPDPNQWSWGKLHVVKFRHPLDHAPDADFDLGPLPRPGDEYTVNATGYWGNSYEQVSGASYREILDSSNWDQSLAVNTPGQSGQPGSAHYSDLMPLWDQGQYFPLAYSRDAVEKATTNRLTLTP